MDWLTTCYSLFSPSFFTSAGYPILCKLRVVGERWYKIVQSFPLDWHTNSSLIFLSCPVLREPFLIYGVRIMQFWIKKCQASSLQNPKPSISKWSLDQQHQCHLKICEKCKLLAPFFPLDLPNQTRVCLAICVLTNSRGDFDSEAGEPLS